MIVNLTAHKNTLKQRERRAIRDNLKHCAKYLASHSEVSARLSGYTIMAWDDAGDVDVYWSNGDIPTSVLGEFCKQTISRRLGMLDNEPV